MKITTMLLTGLAAGAALTATQATAQDYNPNKAPAFTASYTARNLDARKSAERMLAARIGAPVTVFTLLASPYPKANQYCGLAVTQMGGLYTFEGDGRGSLDRISDVKPIANRQNDVAAARTGLFDRCGGVALAHTIVEYGYPAPTAAVTPYLR